MATKADITKTCDCCGKERDYNESVEEGWFGLYQASKPRELDFDICATCAVGAGVWAVIDKVRRHDFTGEVQEGDNDGA